MDPRKLFADERHAAFCVFCGDRPDTREHAASRILLDDPLPETLPLVGSCRNCNSGFSRDEEYLACFLECVIAGSTDPEKLNRSKIKASLRHSPALATRIEESKVESESGQLVWVPEADRIKKVILKLARGHVAHQFSEPRLDDPREISVAPLEVLSDEQREGFEAVPDSFGWPEIGSRAFVNVLVGGDTTYQPDSGWYVLQSGRYRYMTVDSGDIIFRVVLSEYLAGEVVW